MAKLTATKVTKANGGKTVAGYKVALPKVETENNGFKEGDELDIIYKQGEIRIKKARD